MYVYKTPGPGIALRLSKQRRPSSDPLLSSGRPELYEEYNYYSGHEFALNMIFCALSLWNLLVALQGIAYFPAILSLRLVWSLPVGGSGDKTRTLRILWWKEGVVVSCFFETKVKARDRGRREYFPILIQFSRLIAN